jgi:ABC-type transporter lipoprotein component MlaA/pimeloyl-ACP methyl ester carboxylesterase
MRTLLEGIPARPNAAAANPISLRFARQALACLLLACSMPTLTSAELENTARDGFAENQPFPAELETLIFLPEPLTDPLEPLNRGLWSLNKALMTGVIQPTGKAYRFIVRKPLRAGIWNIGRNLEYPHKLVNNLLQTQWAGARDESYRFMANTILGVGGFFDVASRWDIPESPADFGQTFGFWGWKPKVYLMLPLLGPTNDRDALGGFLDRAVNPITYFPPYAYIPQGVTYNNLTESVDGYLRADKTDQDAYIVLKYATSLARQTLEVDFTLEGEPNVAALETLQSVFFKFQNPEFPHRGKTQFLPIPETGRMLPFTFWLQSRKAPIVYVVPGLGSHRLSDGTLALAELLFRHGFSVATISSPYNYEFMERASTAAMPGYAPVDARDLHAALTELDSHLQTQHPNRVTSRALMGYSMGGYQALHLAANEPHQHVDLLQFDRYVAIDAPIQLTYAISQLDDFFLAALDWPPQERTARIENTFLKVAALAKNMREMSPGDPIPLNATEAKFLIGLSFRISLRDVIFLSQMRNNQGILQQPLSSWRREPVYREILQYSFADYLQKFVLPYYQTRGLDLNRSEEFAKANDLRFYTSTLEKNRKIRVIGNSNDFLLNIEDLNWLQTVFPPEHLTLFERGGHLGNLTHPAVQQAIIETLSGL